MQTKPKKNLISCKSGIREEMICLNEQPYWHGGRSYLQQFSILNRICQVGIQTLGRRWRVLNASVGTSAVQPAVGFLFMNERVEWPVFSSANLRCVQSTSVTWSPMRLCLDSTPPLLWTHQSHYWLRYLHSLNVPQAWFDKLRQRDHLDSAVNLLSTWL